MKHKSLLLALVLPLLGLGLFGARAVSARGFGMGPFFGHMGMGQFRLSPDELATRQKQSFEHLATITGLPLEDIKNQWAEGSDLQELLKAKGITQEQVQTRAKEAKIAELKTQLQTLVSKGVITQTQADKRLQLPQKQLEKNGKLGKGAMMKGLRGMHRGWPR